MLAPLIPSRAQVPAEFRIPYRDEHVRGLPLRRFYFEDGLVDPSRSLVCVPGLAASGRSFARLAPLRHRWDLRMVTAPLSVPLPGSPAEALADVLAAYVAGLDRPVLLGTSFGSLVALDAALEAGDGISGLVLVSAVTGGHMVPRRYAAFAGAMLAPRPLAWLAAPLAARILGGARLDPAARKELVRESRLISTAEMFRRVAAILGTDMAALLSAVQVPVLVVHGTRDRVIPPRKAREMVAAVPGWRYVEIQGAGHVPYLSHPRQFLEALEPFLDEVEARRAATAPGS